MKKTLFAALISLSPAMASAADYMLALKETGLREYYCTITVSLTNMSDTTLTEISGFFYSYIGGEQVGRSKGTWFMNVSPGEEIARVFETPNAPCDDVTRYEFVVGACRLGAGFEDVSVCAERIGAEPPLVPSAAGG
ncbi:MAG: hypothetical protein AAGG09_09825 [Pseudomonadota bacterium]